MSFKTGASESQVGGVNVTLGLPIVRTSVAHGTAFDIAGRGVAETSSLVEAVRVAARLAAGRPPRPGAAAPWGPWRGRDDRRLPHPPRLHGRQPPGPLPAARTPDRRGAG